MNSNFNRQFILTDFRLLENREFLKFIGSTEYATYLVLRRFVWRSRKSHYMGLHKMWAEQRLLASSIEREKISQVTGIEPDNISRHLTNLVKLRIVKRIRTGRQNIYVLGEWIDVNSDGSYREHEWFYLDGRFGIPKSDLTHSVRSDLSAASDQTRRTASDNNREVNREENTVSNGTKSPLANLPNIDQPREKTEDTAQQILSRLGDSHSTEFYRMVAAKIPENEIHRALSEIETDGADNPARVFTHRMNQYAIKQLKNSIG